MDRWNINLRNDDGYCEWHEVTDGSRTFKTNIQEDAVWLREILNILDILAGHPGKEQKHGV